MTAAGTSTTSAESRRWWALGALALSVLVVALDLFVLTLALPTVSADLHASSGISSGSSTPTVSSSRRRCSRPGCSATGSAASGC